MWGKMAAGLAVLALGGGVTLAATGAGAQPQHGKEMFTITSNGDGPASITAQGVFDDSGIDIQKQQHDRARLSDGAFSINHPDEDSNFSYSSNPKNCHFHVKGSGKYTLGDGTQAYKHLSGSGTYEFHGQGKANRKADGSCDFNREPAYFSYTVQAQGPVHLNGKPGSVD